MLEQYSTLRSASGGCGIVIKEQHSQCEHRQKGSGYPPSSSPWNSIPAFADSYLLLLPGPKRTNRNKKTGRKYFQGAWQCLLVITRNNAYPARAGVRANKWEHKLSHTHTPVHRRMSTDQIKTSFVKCICFSFFAFISQPYQSAHICRSISERVWVCVCVVVCQQTNAVSHMQWRYLFKFVAVCVCVRVLGVPPAYPSIIAQGYINWFIKSSSAERRTAKNERQRKKETRIIVCKH